MPHPQAILFDLGDTLWDSEPLDRRRIFRLCARRTYDPLIAAGHALPPFEHYFRLQFSLLRRAYLWSRLRGRDANGRDVLRRFCLKMNLPADDEALSRLLWHWYQPRLERTTIHPGTIPALHRLRDAGIKLAIVSNSLIPGAVLDRHLDLLGLLPFFPVRVYSSEVGHRKPRPRIFLTALRQLAVPAQNAAFVGDRPKTDILGARRLGMSTILRTTRRASHSLADFTVREIADLPALLPSLHRALTEAEPLYTNENEMQPTAIQ
jgi:putative hydrolase of the HAD superfamily